MYNLLGQEVLHDTLSGSPVAAVDGLVSVVLWLAA
jgi:hypothetical protein